MTSIDASARHDLTDAQWALLEPLLPAPPVRGRPRRYPLRAMIDAVRWRTRVGAPWRDVPARVRALVEGVRPVPRLAVERGVGAHRGGPGRCGPTPPGRSTGGCRWTRAAVRAHVHAAGARGDSVERVEGEPDDHALGRSRGGWGTKIHAAVEAGLGAGSLLLTAGQAGDCPMMIPVLEAISVKRPARGRPRTRPDRVLADRAYSSRANRDWLRAHHIRATIPVKADQAANRRRRGGAGGRPPAFDPDVYKDRNAVERGFSRLKHNRGLATRYDKLAVRYRTTTRIAAIDHWLKRLT